MRVLLVSERDVCRAPAAVHLLHTQLTPAAAVTLSSAGLAAEEGQPINPAVAWRLGVLGHRPTGHASRHLSVDLIVGSDLILTATRDQASVIVGQHPSVLRRTFSLMGFARLAAAVPTGGRSGDEWLERLLANRARAVTLRHPTDDLPDPYDTDDQTLIEVLERIRDACVGIARSYRGLGT
jgi:protein-tyrosine phosphatase